MSASADPARSDLRVLVRGGTINAVGSVASFVFNMLLVVVVSRALDARGTGIFFEAVALFSILASAAQLGADTGLVRSISRFRVLDRVADLRTVLGVALGPVLVVGALYALAVWFFAPQLADLFFHGVDPAEGAASLRVLAPFLPLAAASVVALSGARGFGTMLPYVAVEQVAKPMLRPALVLAAVALGLSIRGVLLAWAVPVAVGFPIALVAIRRLLRRAESTLRDREPSRPPRALAREFWAFAAPRGLAILFQISVIWLGTLLVGAIAGVREAGLYAAASRFALIGLFALEAVRLAIAPQLSGLLAADDRPRAQGLYQVATWWIMLPTWPLYLIVAVFAPLLLRIFGPEFQVAAPALLILSLGMLASMGTGNVTVILLMGGKSWWNLANVAIALTVNITLNLVLVPRLGITGAAIAWVASILCENLIPLVQIGLHFRLHPFGRGYLIVAAASLACYGALGLAARAVLGPTVLALAVTLVVGTAAYLRVVWRNRELLELTTLADAVRSRLRRGAPVEEAAAP